MATKSRTYNSIANSMVGIGASLITIVLNFIVRIVIVRELGEEINGIHNLFQSITDAITLIEAGFSTAMLIHLYKPIEERNHKETAAIMRFYSSIYRNIAIIFVLICIVIDVFFLQYIVKSSVPINDVRVYFSIFMLITPFNYLTYYKISILYAEQRSRVYAMARSGGQLVFRSLQILSVYITHDYHYFIILMILEVITINTVCGKIVNKSHSYLKKRTEFSLPKEKKDAIYRTVRPIFVNNIASNIQTSSKGILIGALFSSVSLVGYFGSYQLVATTIASLFSQFGASITSGFGNLAVSEDKESMYAAYRKTVYILSWFAILMCSVYVCCIHPFIQICFGENFVLPSSTTFIITAELFIYLLNVPIISIQNALGLHRKDQIVMVVQAFTALVLGYFMGRYYGMSGLLLGLIIPQFMFTLINKGMVITRYAFDKPKLTFIKVIFTEISKGLCIISLCYISTSMINTSYLILDIAIRAMLVVCIVSIIFISPINRGQYYNDTVTLIKKILNRNLK